MKNLIAIIVGINLCLYPMVADDLQTKKEKPATTEYEDLLLNQFPDLTRAPLPAPTQGRIPQYPVPPVFHVKQGIIVASIGGGLLVAGLALAASSGSAPGIFQVEDRRNTAKLYGGTILAGVGVAFLWHGLCKLK